MEAVRAFNNELSSLYEVRPPVSRAKMTHITKCAIKAIKFYKHVVQSVEKFVLKCKPDYKVPGLYVVDSIVRQSRHQFGAEKDVYAPRFTKNIVTTFQNLLKCPPDEKSKIVRVLNLWQKNSVFPIEVIQPLMDLAGDPLNADLIAAAQRAVDRIVPSAKPGQQKGQSHTPVKQADPLKAKPEPVMNSQASADSILTTQTDMLNTVNQLLQQTQQPQSLDEQQQQLQQLQILQQQLLEQTQMMQQPEDQGPVIDNTLLAQIQTLTNQLLTRTTDHKPPEPAFNKNLLDFDYGESDEEDKEGGANNNNAGPVQHLLTDQTLMTQIKQMSQTIQKTEQLNTEMSMQEQFRQRLQQQQEEFDQQINQGTMARGPIHIPPPGQPLMPQFPGMMDASHPPPDHPQTMESEDVMVVQDERDRRGRDRSRSPKRRRRSRSRSRDRRKRSRSRDRHRRSRSEEREKNRERERERWKKRLPPIKDKQVSVCSTTIFVGHLAKLTSEEELVRELENYGAVDSINMIPPRGCAFVCMNRRKDAAKAVEKMKGMKINGSAIKIAWAPGKGMKDLGFKDSWYVDLGVTYIPWDKLPTDLSVLVDGGIIDEDTLPDHLKELAAAMLRAETGAEDKQQGPPPVEPQSGPVGMPPGGPPPPGPQPIPQGQPPFHPPLPTGIPPGNSIRVLQPGPPVGMINPMLIPMPGQSLPPMPGAQVGMHPVMALSQPRHPQGVRIPLMSIPNQPTTSAGSQLNVAIQNIMASSGGPTPVKDTRPHLVRPGFNSPRPGLFQVGFNPQQPSPHPPQGYNPNVPPPRVGHPNFRMPPPSFGGQAPLGDGDSTPEQDEGQATITKVISNDWPNKYSNRESENSFPGGGPPFGQPQENRMPLSHEQKLLQTPPMGNRLPLPRGLTPIFSQHNSPMNANSPRPLLGQRMMRPERPDTNGPQIRQLLGGPQGMAQPFGSGGHGRPPRPQGGMGEMDGPQPLMGNRFTGPRPPGPSLLGLRPGFPGSRMLAPLHRFQAEQAGGPRHNFPRPMDDRIRPLMDSPGRPFERPEFDRFGDRDRMRFPGPHGNRHDGRPPIPDRWGPLDGPPGIERDRERDRDMDRDRDNPRDRPPFDRFERNEFRRPHEDRRSHEEPPPDWRMNRRENRNHHSQEEEMGLPESGGRRWQEEPRDEPERGPERAGRDKDRARRSRWSNLDPSQVGDRPPLLNESTETMDDSVSMEDANSSMNELPDQSVQGDAQHLPKDVLGGAGATKTDKPDGEGAPTESLTEGKGLPEIPLPVPNPVSAVVNSPVPTQEPSQDAATPMKVNPFSEGLPKSADSAPLERNVCMPPMGDVPQPENTAEPPVPSMTGGNHTQISQTPKVGLEVSPHVKPMQSDSEAAKSMDEGNGTENGSIFIANKDPALGKSVSDVTSQVEAKERSPMEEGELEPGEVSS